MSNRSLFFAAWGLVAAGFGLVTGGDRRHVASAADPAPPGLIIALDAEGTRATVLQGSSIARSPGGARIYVADEPNKVVHVATLSSAGNGAQLAAITVKTKGAPAQLVAFDDTVLVTIRRPSALVAMRPHAESGLTEEWRLPLPDDAWGLAVSSDHRTALVTSAWSHRLTAIDLGTKSVRWSIDVAREPRGIAIRPDGKLAYVSHLTSATITALEGIDEKAPTVRQLELPVAPLAILPDDRFADASLGYALVLSPDATRLYAPRQALGELGSWMGTLTVDVLQTPIDLPLLPPREPEVLGASVRAEEDTVPVTAHGPASDALMTKSLAVPRAAVFRASTKTLLVLGEGTANLVELDARSLAPAMQRLRSYPLGTCAAATGVVLSADESLAFVQCAASFEVMRVALRGAYEYRSEDNGFVEEAFTVSASTYALDPLGSNAALGRRLFYDATDVEVSGGFSCAGCHPDGRDDGHVWSQVETFRAESAPSPYGSASESLQPVVLNSSPKTMAFTGGAARQTPMLAGRVDAPGPYGWTAESKTLVARVQQGMKLHRWSVMWSGAAFTKEANEKAWALVAFLRQGLVAPQDKAPELLSDVELEGKKIFEGSGQCAGCHVTTSAAPLGAFHLEGYAVQAAFEPEPKAAFKAPSLRFVSGTAPYLHDGSARTLEELVDDNADRMGVTSTLGEDGRAALVAYLRTL